MILPGDGTEYEILTDAARRTTVPGLVCEIGTRLGGGIQAIIDGLTSPRVILSIDPYGDIPYNYSDHHGVRYEMGYDQKMMVEAFRTIPQACMDKGHLWVPFVMEDVEFFKRYEYGAPVYWYEKAVARDYAVVHLDGPHNTDAVIHATAFFASPCKSYHRTPIRRMPVGGVIVYDNIDFFKFEQVERLLDAFGFECEAKGKTKAAYRRVK